MLVFFPFKVIPDVPTVDLAFALSATAADADTNFKLMKDTITSFADMYGMSKINYAVIAYGETPRRWVDFQNQPSDFEALKKMVDDVSRETGVVALDKGLEEAKKLFDSARPHARKVKKNCSTTTVHVFGKCGGQMVSVLDSGSSGPGSSTGWGQCVVFLGKTLYSHSASLHPGV